MQSDDGKDEWFRFGIARLGQGVHLARMNAKAKPTTQTADTAVTTAPKLRYEPKPKGSWMKLYGSMKDCDLYPDALRLGAEWRERMNREGR